MSKGVKLVPILLMGFALSLSVFVLWTSPSLEEEQLRKKTRRQQLERNSYQLPRNRQKNRLGNGGGGRRLHQKDDRKYAFEADNGELLSAIPLLGGSAGKKSRYRMLLIPVGDASVHANQAPGMTMAYSGEATAHALKDTRTDASSQEPVPSETLSSEATLEHSAGRLSEETASTAMAISSQQSQRGRNYQTIFFVLRLSLMGTMIMFLFARHHLRAAFSDGDDRIAEDDDSDVSQYSTGGLIYSNSPADVGYGTIAFWHCDDSFEKFDL
ncbi:expressed unknown protein [Seminavis robusta]|uniref:Uncharacterized protein n=1 Tax=Seminavis robusta TaxID=568900 RepID=A0A9N8DTA0_9STRA|nr:expressed unknown protein [Seminavis robusta]|eukprot:Sro335_g120110.1 n/a (270) ;mRNA; r:43061-43870